MNYSLSNRWIIARVIAFALILNLQASSIYALGNCVDEYDKIHESFLKKEQTFWVKNKRKNFVLVRSVIHRLRDLMLRSFKVFNVHEFSAQLTFDSQRTVITADRAANPNRTKETIVLEGSKEAVKVDAIVEGWIKSYESFERDVKESFETAAYHEARYQALSKSKNVGKRLLPKDLLGLDINKEAMNVEMIERGPSGKIRMTSESIPTLDSLITKIRIEKNQRNSYLGKVGFISRDGVLSDRIKAQTYLHQQLLILRSRLAYYSSKTNGGAYEHQALLKKVDGLLKNEKLNPSYNSQNKLFWKRLFAEAEFTVKKFASSEFVKRVTQVEKQLTELETSGLGIGAGHTISIAQVVSKLTVITAFFTTLGLGSLNIPDIIFHEQNAIREIAESKTEAEYELKMAEFMKEKFSKDYDQFLFKDGHIPIHKQAQLEKFMSKLKEIESQREIVQNERALDKAWEKDISDLKNAVERGSDLTIPVIADSTASYQFEVKSYLMKYHQNKYIAYKKLVDTWIQNAGKESNFKVGLRVKRAAPEIYHDLSLAASKRVEYLNNLAAEPNLAISAQAENIITDIVAQVYRTNRLASGVDISQ